jgi:hypothetical protein
LAAVVVVGVVVGGVVCCKNLSSFSNR